MGKQRKPKPSNPKRGLSHHDFESLTPEAKIERVYAQMLERETRRRNKKGRVGVETTYTADFAQPQPFQE